MLFYTDASKKYRRSGSGFPMSTLDCVFFFFCRCPAISFRFRFPHRLFIFHRFRRRPATCFRHRSSFCFSIASAIRSCSFFSLIIPSRTAICSRSLLTFSTEGSFKIHHLAFLLDDSSVSYIFHSSSTHLPHEISIAPLAALNALNAHNTRNCYT